jgi:hypothetical protein
MAITKQSVVVMREKMEEALKTLESFGFNAKISNIRYSGSQATMFVTVSEVTKTEDGEVLSVDNASYLAHCVAFGLKKEWLGKTFMYQGKQYKVEGISPKSRKFPVICMNDNGDVYKFPASHIVLNFADGNKASATDDDNDMPNIVRSSINSIKLFQGIDIDLGNPEHATIVASRLAGNLSPECLFADGERSRTEAKNYEKELLTGIKYIGNISGMVFDPKKLCPDY